MKTIRVLQLLPLFLLACIQVLAFCGCSSSDALRVNEAILTSKRPTYSTARCLELARQSRKMLAQKKTDYRIGSGDVLEISVYGLEKRGEYRTVTMRVEASGEIKLPIIPPINVKGLTVAELERKITDVMIAVDFIKSPRISVVVTEYQSRRVAVLGSVNAPGEFTIRHNEITLYEALAKAGGPTKEAGYKLHLIRGLEDLNAVDDPGAADETITVDLVSLMKEADLNLNLVLRHGDVVYVPEAEYFYVIGFVHSPGGFPLNRPVRVLDGIALSAGLIPKEASPRHCVLKRYENDMEVNIPLDLVAIADGLGENIFLRPDDVIDVRQTSLRFWTLEIWDFLGGIPHIGYDLNPRSNNRR